jgi:hypothetical protein
MIRPTFRVPPRGLSIRCCGGSGRMGHRCLARLKCRILPTPRRRGGSSGRPPPSRGERPEEPFNMSTAIETLSRAPDGDGLECAEGAPTARATLSDTTTELGALAAPPTRPQNKNYRCQKAVPPTARAQCHDAEFVATLPRGDKRKADGSARASHRSSA